MTITYELDLNSFKAWSGAIDTLDRIKREGKCEELESILEDTYPDGMTETELNDLLWFDEAAEVYDYQVENYGRVTQNPFENPEAWMVCMIIEGCANLIGQCKCVEEIWNDEVELTEELAEQIKEEIKGLSINF